MTNTGEKIRARREYLQMTQEELAHKVGYKSRVSINKIELKRDIPIKKLKPIADALEMDVWDLMGWKEEAEYSEDNAELLGSLMHDTILLEYIKKIQSLSTENRKQLYDYTDFLLSKN